jgi:hypothetical protein
MAGMKSFSQQAASFSLLKKHATQGRRTFAQAKVRKDSLVCAQHKNLGSINRARNEAACLPVCKQSLAVKQLQMNKEENHNA